MQPNRAPIYIVSKGRWEKRQTSKALDGMGLAHYIVVEEQEAEAYSAAAEDRATILVLDKAYQRDYDPCDALGDSKGKGPGPARNFAWDHALKAGATWHWVMDDNILQFFRLNRNRFARLVDGAGIRCMEDFAERYTNVAMAGPNYFFFAARKNPLPHFVANTRIYSCNLIRNDLSYRWRGRYNEDTDLSLRLLKDGWCTVLFNAFLQDKNPTNAQPGGNTAEFYVADGTLPKSQMIVRLHPDIASLVWRYGRWHHHVDYSQFKRNRLRRKPGLEIPDEPNEYGMVFQKKVGATWSNA